MTKRTYTKRPPVAVQPSRLEAGEYLTLTDYARSKGITRLTAYNALKRGYITGIRIGGRAVLIRV